MTRDTNAQPFATLHEHSQTLREQSMFAHRQAATGAERARQVSTDLADLDLEKAFSQLRQMVALVGGKSAPREDTVVAFPAHRALLQAAE